MDEAKEYLSTERMGAYYPEKAVVKKLESVFALPMSAMNKKTPCVLHSVFLYFLRIIPDRRCLRELPQRRQRLLP